MIQRFGMFLLGFALIGLTGCMDREGTETERTFEELQVRMETSRAKAEEARATRTKEAWERALEARERAEQAWERARQRRRALGAKDRARYREAWERAEEAREEAMEAWDEAAEVFEAAYARDDHFARSMHRLGEKLREMGEALGQDADVDPVAWRDLGKLLPREVAGLTRTDVEGETSEALGIHVTNVEATYENDDTDLTIHVVDLGTLSGVVMAGIDWLDAKVDRGGAWGYERTTHYRGYPAFEKVYRERRHTRFETQMIVAERFVVAIEMEGRNLDEDDLEAVRDALDYDRLEGLRNH